jgi:hypothetical protein
MGWQSGDQSGSDRYFCKPLYSHGLMIGEG